MNFQNPSMQGSEFMLCTKKGNTRTDGRTNQKQYATYFLKFGA